MCVIHKHPDAFLLLKLYLSYQKMLENWKGKLKGHVHLKVDFLNSETCK